MPYPPIDRRALPPALRLAMLPGHAGWRLRAFDWPAERAGGAGVRGSMLFQTGRGDFIEKYAEPIGHWHDRGWNVAGFDWRGQGGSDRTGPPAGKLFTAMLADLADYVADWLARTPPPHVLIGHSMGAHMLMRLLSERPAVVDAAVFVAPMLGLVHRPLRPRTVRLIARAAAAIGLADRPLWQPAEVDPLVRQVNLTGCVERYADEAWWCAANPSLAIGAPSWGWLAGALGSIARLERPDAIERITPPALIVATERDRLVSATAIRHAAARLPDARLAWFDGAHELLREADGVRLPVLAAIDGFLDERAPPA